jgi:WD40 repeat protein
VAVSADGGRVVAAGGAAAKVWDAEGRELRTLRGHTDLVYGVAISPDGTRILSAGFDQVVKVWDAETGKALRTLRGHASPVYGVAVSAGGRHIVSAGKDRSVRVWDGEGRAELTLKGHTDSVTGVAVSADGRHIVSGSRDGTIMVWDARECEQTSAQEAESQGPAEAGDSPSGFGRGAGPAG